MISQGERTEEMGSEKKLALKVEVKEYKINVFISYTDWRCLFCKTVILLDSCQTNQMIFGI